MPPQQQAAAPAAAAAVVPLPVGFEDDECEDDELAHGQYDEGSSSSSLSHYGHREADKVDNEDKHCVGPDGQLGLSLPEHHSEQEQHTHGHGGELHLQLLLSLRQLLAGAGLADW